MNNLAEGAIIYKTNLIQFVQEFGTFCDFDWLRAVCVVQRATKRYHISTVDPYEVMRSIDPRWCQKCLFTDRPSDRLRVDINRHL